MKSSNVCYCRQQTSSKILPGYCSTCNGTLADTPEAKIKPSTLEELMSIKSQFVESAYFKTLKNLFKSSSSPTLTENLKHKRSNTSNKLVKSKDLIPEEGPGINKINSLQIEAHPNTRSVPFLTGATLKSSVLLKPRDSTLTLESTKPMSYKNFVVKHHDRAFSSRIENSIYERDAWQKPGSAFSNYSEGKKPGELNIFRFTGHKNSVNCFCQIQGKLISGGSDYRLNIQPHSEVHLNPLNKSQLPANSIRAHSRSIRALSCSLSNILISAGDSKTIKLWSISRGFSCIQVLSSPEPSTKCLVSPLTHLLSAGTSGQVHLWDLERKKVIRSHQASSKCINTLVEFSKDLYISGANDGVASLIDYRCLRNVANFYHNDRVLSLLDCPSQSFYSASDKFRRWDVRSQSALFEAECDQIRSIERVGCKIVTGGKFVTFWQDDSPLNILSEYPQVNVIRYDRNLDLLVLGRSDGEITVKNIQGIKVQSLNY